MRKIKYVSAIGLILALLISVSAIADNQKEAVHFVPAERNEIDNASCRYTQPEDEDARAASLLADMSGFDLQIENNTLAVYYCNTTSSVRLLDKRTGYIWGSLPAGEIDDLNESWAAFAQSVITVDYFDESLQSVRLPLSSKDTVCIVNTEGNKLVFDVRLSIGISFGFSLELGEDNVRFSLLRNTIRETGTAFLQSVWFMPFFGAVRQDSIDGYMFIPDGCGALIRYEKSGKYISPYEQRIYGKDMSIDSMSNANDVFSKRSTDYLTDVAQVTMPVYGVVHGPGQNAYLAVVENGAEHASVYASPSGYVVDYSWVTTRFDYRQIYYTPVNKNGGSIADTQKQAEDFDAAVTYYFLTGKDADYTGMALKYRSLLENEGNLPEHDVKEESVPLYLNVMAADVKESLFGKRFVSLTTIDQMNHIVDSLYTNGIKNLTVVYNGWRTGGLSGANYGKGKLDRRLGNEAAMKALQAKIAAWNGNFYLGIDTINANEDQIRPQSSAALTVYKELAQHTLPNTSLMYPTKYYEKTKLVKEYITKVSNSEWNYSFNGLGISLYGDYTDGDVLLRTDMRKMITEAMAGVEGKAALTNPNQYLWKSTHDYFEMPVNNSQYLFETDTVPFLPILLKGDMNYYAPYMNQAFYSQSSILKMIEYGAYPSIMITGAGNKTLSETTLADYFSLCYDEWQEVITNVYTKVNDALKAVSGEKITDHKALTTGVVAVQYESGTLIYVNYTNSDYKTENGDIVAARNYFVRRAV